jgi:hypothetical protein
MDNRDRYPAQACGDRDETQAKHDRETNDPDQPAPECGLTWTRSAVVTHRFRTGCDPKKRSSGSTFSLLLR